jgi:hypothetical protein
VGHKTMMTTTPRRVLHQDKTAFLASQVIVRFSPLGSWPLSRENLSLCLWPGPGLYIRADRAPFQATELLNPSFGQSLSTVLPLSSLLAYPHYKNFRAFNRGTRTRSSRAGRQSYKFTSRSTKHWQTCIFVCLILDDVLESLVETDAEAKRPKCPSRNRDRDVLKKCIEKKKCPSRSENRKVRKSSILSSNT